MVQFDQLLLVCIAGYCLKFSLKAILDVSCVLACLSDTNGSPQASIYYHRGVTRDQVVCIRHCVFLRRSDLEYFYSIT